MSRKLAIGTAAAFIVGLAAFILVVETGSSVLVGSGPGLSDPRASVEQATSKSSRKFAGQMSERKKRIKGLAKLDRPDLFAQYHVDIRTRHGEAAPSYPPNYKVDELLKAKKLYSTKALGKAISSNQLEWVERGPGNVSGRTRGLIVDPDDPGFNTWYAGSVGGGVWKTADAGQSWTELTAALPNLATSALAMAPSNPDVIYVGTGEGFGNFEQINGSGIWKTTDRGLTWEQLASTANLEFQNVTRIIIDPADHNTLLVTTSVGFYRAPTTSGIHRSINGGVSWTKVFDSVGNAVEQIIANPDNFNTQYATVNGIGVIKSIDGGVTWADASAGIGGVGRLEIAIAPSDPSILYLSAQGGTSGSILYVSVDAGANWVQGADASGDVHWLGGQGWYDNTIAVNPYDATEVFVGGINMWRIDVGTSIDTTGFQVTGIDQENTSSFLSFVNFGGALLGGGIDFGDPRPALSDYTTIEIRFGPEKSQKAHRFLVPAGETSGVPAANYTYPSVDGYVDVPFELWDIEDSANEVQLMVSFRDQTRNGVWELALFNDLTTREYVFLSAEPYDPNNPHPSMAVDGGHTHRQLYFMWPVLPTGGSFDPNNLPASTLRIKWGRFITTSITTSQVTDFTSFTGPTEPINVHVDHHNIIMIPIDAATKDFEILNANDGGVYHSVAGGDSWRNTLTGYNTTQFYGVDKKNGANEFIGGMQDNSTWRSPAGVDASALSRWTFQFGGDGFETVWHYTDPSKLLGSISFNLIARSLDGGATWFFAINGMDDVITGAPFFTKLAKSKQDPDLVFAVGESGVWRTDNFASSWTLTQMPDGWNGTSSFSQVKTSLVNPQIVWAGSDMVPESPLYVSTDGGLTFAATAVFPDVTLGRITGLETHPTEDSTAFALFSFANAPKILRTTDLGQTWAELSGFGTGTASTNGFPDVAVYSLLVMPRNPQIIWAGTEIGIFESVDGGANWADADNGFPPTLVFELLIVNDQVVVATHGRGVWSVALPQLDGYEPPAAILAPRFNQIAGGGGGIINADLALKSAYDSSFVVIDGENFLKIDANAAALDTMIQLVVSVDQPKTVAFSLTSYKAGITFRSPAINLDVFPLQEARQSYSNDFNSVTTDFVFNGLLLTRSEIFQSQAIHSPHPYLDAPLRTTIDLTALLTVPIILTSQNATLSYDDIAIVESGEEGVPFGEFGFWDYVIVEGSNDNGATWRPFADGYDARFDPAWLTAYNNNADGEQSMFRTHTFNMLGPFSSGDIVIIRFRLNIDEAVTGWGWVIDNLMIQPGEFSVDRHDQLPTVFSLAQNYPNPFNPTTKISYALPKTTAVKLQIFNLLGQRVRVLVDNNRQPAGTYTIEWDGKDDLGRAVSSGMYYYRIEAGEFVKSHKMIMLK